MTIVKSSPTLQARTRTGAGKFWQGHVVQDGAGWFTQTSYWQVNKDGVKSVVQFSEPYEATPKNVGKANETSAEEQAHFEFASMVQKQVDKGYAEVGAVSKVRPLPMLAHKFKDRKKSIVFPGAFVQPKFDGNRMLQRDGECWSRGGKDMVEKVVAHLKFDTEGQIVDGELILPNNVPLEATSTALKSYKPGESERLLYIVYDMVSDKPFSERYAALKSLVERNAPAQVVLAPTFVVKNAAEVMAHFKSFIKQGYEGVIIRNDQGAYEVGHRSVNLQKYKEMLDLEYRIVGVKEGDGRERGCAIFTCVTEGGNEFDVRPEGSLESRQESWKSRKDLIGKWLTVRFQSISTKNQVPVFPVGVCVREDGEF